MAIPYKPQQLPQVQTLNFNIGDWEGLNQVKGKASLGEMVDMQNMTSNNYPYSSPREPRETIATGIVNPQKVISAGGKLGYIAGEKLYFDNNGTFEDKGNVGVVSSYVDFNENVIMYPSDFAYDYNTNSLTAVVTYLSVKVGSYNRGASPSSMYDSTITNIKTFNNTGTSTVGDKFAATYCLTNPIDVTGLTTITFNQSGLTGAYSNNDYSHLMNYSGAVLFLTILDASNVNLKLPASTEYGEFYYQVNFGVPFALPTGAKTVYANIGYYVRDELNSTTNPDTTSRDADYAKLIAIPSTAKIWKSSTTYPAEGTIPQIEFACVDNNRIFAVESDNIYACALGNYSDWTTFVDANGNSSATGAFATDTGTPGKFTGVAKFKGRVVMTKEDLIYESYGNRPPYTINEIAKTGCIDGRSIIEVNSVLYWLGRNGIFSYTGGQPRNISDKLTGEFTKGVSGTDGRKYYCCLFDTRWRLYVYDTYNGLWHIEDFIEIVDFAYNDGYLYALSKDGNLLKFNSGNERVKWEFTTQDYTFGIPETKNVSKLYIRADMKYQTSLDVYLKVNNGEFNRVATYQADNSTVFDFKVRVKKCDTFAVRFSGVGDVRILDVHAKVTMGTSKHRLGDSLSVFRG